MPGQSLASVVICSTQKTWRKPVYSTSPSSSSTSRCPWKVSHKRTDRESQKNVFGLWSVASNSGGKKPNSAKRGRSSGCGVPRRTARRALRPVRTKKVTWLLPTAHAPWQAWATRKVLSIWSNTLVSQGPKCWHVCKSGTKALKNEGGSGGGDHIYIYEIYTYLILLTMFIVHHHTIANVVILYLYLHTTMVLQTFNPSWKGPRQARNEAAWHVTRQPSLYGSLTSHSSINHQS